VREASTRAHDRATLRRMTYRAAEAVWLEAPFQTEIRIGAHRLIADEPPENGGADAGPTPHDLLLAALGACTSMTLRMYAHRKGWPLTGVQVHLTQDAADGTHRFFRRIALEGTLDETQRARLLEIANKCPVHRTLTGKITITTELVSVPLPVPRPGAPPVTRP
jgi:putative redox protein